MEKEKTFKDSRLSLVNRNSLSLTGVEKVLGANEQRIFMKVSGSILVVSGINLSIDKLDVDNGTLELTGTVDEIKYSKSINKGSFFKRIFK